MALGVLAVALFGATLPITRWTMGTGGGPADAPAMSALFITFSRVVLAAGISALCLLALRARWPSRQEWGPLAVAAAGNAVLYPLSLALALREQSAAHVAVITALLPLATAAAAAVAAGALRARGSRSSAGATDTAGIGGNAGVVGATASVHTAHTAGTPAATSPNTHSTHGHRRFWLCALASTALVALFSLQRSGQPFAFVADDLIVAGGVLAASLGYVQGAKVTRSMGAERVICWVTLLTLPVSLPLTFATWPAGPVPAAAWGGLAYLGLVSMWAAFFAWYRALDWGGPLRVSQTQAFQPFFSIALAWPLLGEMPDFATLAFAAAVVALVVVGTRR
jgi:drug/metabolite transporter (DMT)-like permease